MIYLLAGVLLLVAGLWLVRAFVEADPEKLARGARPFLVALGGAFVVIFLIILALSGRLIPALVGISGIAPFLLRLWRRHHAARGPPPGQASDVETDYLHMHLDHDSATISGTVKRGAHQGRRLGELSLSDLLALWRECRAADEAGASLLEAYLDRLRPDWREAAQRAAFGDHATPTGDVMTEDEAYAILGLSPGASPDEIREAHRRLMMKLHPDHGGSTYLASKLNLARETLLKDGAGWR